VIIKFDVAVDLFVMTKGQIITLLVKDWAAGYPSCSSAFKPLSGKIERRRI